MKPKKCVNCGDTGRSFGKGCDHSAGVDKDQLIKDLWSFIEESRHTQAFFALRERVREFYDEER